MPTRTVVEFALQGQCDAPHCSQLEQQPQVRLGQNGLLIISVCGIMVDGVQKLHQDLLDPRRSAKTSTEYAQILIRLHRKLKSEHPVDHVQLWAKVPDRLPHLRRMKHTTDKRKLPFCYAQCESTHMLDQNGCQHGTSCA